MKLCESVLPATNLCLLLKLCYLQRVSIRCWNCVGCIEYVFTAEIVLPIVNQFSLSNCVVCNELAFAIKLCLAIANQFPLLNYGVCSELTFIAEECCLQQISVRYWIFVVCRKSVFTAEFCCLQRISFCWIVEFAANQFSLPNYGVHNESFSLLNCGVSRESVFAAELWCQ
jgi:hypothetical protein